MTALEVGLPAEAAIEDRVAQAVAFLGTTSRDIRLALRAMEIRGKRNSATDNPISRFLVNRLGITGKVMAFKDVVFIRLQDDGGRPQWVYVACVTEALKSFLASFDAGHYSELVQGFQGKNRRYAR